MTPLIIAVLVFVAITAVLGVVLFLFDDNSGRVNDRLATMTGRKRKDDELTSVLKKNAVEQDKASLIAAFMPNIPSLAKYMMQAEVNMTPASLLGICGVLAAAGFFVSSLVVKVYFAPLLAIVVGVQPFVWLWWKRGYRLKKFGSQLPDALELVARALRAGHSLAAGMHVVAEEMPAPINGEFNRVYEEQNLGIPIEDAMKNMCERVPNLDLRFFVTSVLVQRQTGGDLSEILDKIGYVVRERFRILGQVQALTAEGRLSGIVLLALPIGLFLMMLHIKYDYVEKLWTHPLGIKMAIGGLIMQILGALVIRKIVNIKV